MTNIRKELPKSAEKYTDKALWNWLYNNMRTKGGCLVKNMSIPLLEYLKNNKITGTPDLMYKIVAYWYITKLCEE